MGEREETEFYSMSHNEALGKLGASAEGLTAAEAGKRNAEHGANELKSAKKVSAIGIFFRQFKSFIVFILIFAAIVSSIIGDHLETVVIICIILFIVFLSFVEEYKASKDMEALESLTPKKARVIRAGIRQDILARDVAIGDILALERGDIVAADARILSSNRLQIDESPLTGESVPVNKVADTIAGKKPLSGQSNMVFSGTMVLNGDARAVAVKTGLDTEIGKISKMMGSIKEEQTPLQKRIDTMSKQMSIIAIVICVLIFIIGIVRGQAWQDMLILTLGVLISGIPESIPTVIAVALAVGVKRMAKQKAIIKRLPAVETLGATTVICTDKTGTLTQNKMVIENIYTLDNEITITGYGFNPEGLFMIENKVIEPQKHNALSKLIEIGVLCNNASLKNEGGEWKIDGESTEGALIVMAKKAGIHKEEYERTCKRILEHPFDPERKCMSTIHIVQNQPIVYTKGAPELLLKKTKYFLCGGEVRALTAEETRIILNKNEEYAAKGLRVLGLAYKEHKGDNFDLNIIESNLIFVGLVSIRDPPEENAKMSISMCREAGIKVVMITGDNEVTAKAIARELGIFDTGHLIITGDRLNSMPERELLDMIDNVSIFARVTPEHKLKIVEAFQKKGHIVAMTGDGVNDAPALKKANIGIAMGKCGTDVAKEAAEMIILDDNFTTIANAVKEGRTIYSNIRKFIYYVLVGGFAEVILMFISILLGAKPVLTAVMILFVNLVTGDLPSFGLCVEKPDNNIMKQKPRDIKEGVLSDFLLLKIAELIPFIVFGTLLLFMWEIVMKGGTIQKAQTMAFTTLIMFELFHVLNAKTWEDTLFSKDILNNRSIFLGIGASLILTVIAVQFPPAQIVFGTVGLTWDEWLAVSVMSCSVLFFRELEKTVINSEIKERKKMMYSPSDD